MFLHLFIFQCDLASSFLAVGTFLYNVAKFTTFISFSRSCIIPLLDLSMLLIHNVLLLQSFTFSSYIFPFANRQSCKSGAAGH